MSLKLAVVLGVCVVAVALTGCASQPGQASSSASPAASFSSPAFGYSISYDPRKMTVRGDTEASRRDARLVLPGIGPLRGETQVVIVSLKEPSGLLERERGECMVLAVKADEAPQPPSLASFRGEAAMRQLRAAGYLLAPPQKTTLNGQPAFRYDGRSSDDCTAVSWEILSGDYVYHVHLSAGTKRWKKVAPNLVAVAQTFTVAQ